MSTLAPEKVYPKAPEDDELDHITCHCTDNKISFCKLDVSDVPVLLDGMEPNVCPTCVLMYELANPKCPFGCACVEECNFLT